MGCRKTPPPIISLLGSSGGFKIYPQIVLSCCFRKVCHYALIWAGFYIWLLTDRITQKKWCMTSETMVYDLKMHYGLWLTLCLVIRTFKQPHGKGNMVRDWRHQQETEASCLQPWEGVWKQILQPWVAFTWYFDCNLMKDPKLEFSTISLQNP